MQDNSFGRLLTVFVQPAKTFRSIAERPTWFVALLTLSLVSLAAVTFIVPKLDWEQNIRQTLAERSTEVDEEQIQTHISAAEKVGAISTYGLVAVTPWIFYPITALIFLGLFKMAGGQLGFQQSLAVSAHGFLPGLVKLLLSLPVVAGMKTVDVEAFQSGSFLSSNLGFLAGADASPAVGALLSSADVFSLWTIILLVIGYGIAAKVSRGTAVACVGGLWLFGIAIKVGLAMLGQAIG